MTRREILIYSGFLVLLGAGWGITLPLTKIVVSTGHKHFGLVFWQLVIGASLMALICKSRGFGLPFSARHVRLYLLLAVIGTILPNTASYQAAVHLPAGVASILLSMVPMWAFPIALIMGLDRFLLRRFFGLLAGLTGVMLIVVSGQSLEGSIPAFWVGLALLAGLCYAIEGNIVAKWGTLGLNPFQVLFGASLVGVIAVLPATILTGQWIDPIRVYAAPELSLIAASMIHVLVYSGYVWLVTRAGSVFAVQVSYMVTGFGVLWSKLILDEAYPPSIWLALALMFTGMFLVQPRPKAVLAETTPISETD
ncbi:MAG: DMT family transporter [Sulfitobacter sp.]